MLDYMIIVIAAICFLTVAVMMISIIIALDIQLNTVLTILSILMSVLALLF